MKRFLCSAAFLLLPALAGCGSARLFEAYPVPESETASNAPWPRLVDTPETPPKGTYTAQIPDPAVGVALTTDLGHAAGEARTRAGSLQEPVLTEAERRRLAGG